MTATAETPDDFIRLGLVGLEDRGPYFPGVPFMATHAIRAAVDLKDAAGSPAMLTWGAGPGSARVVPALRFDPVRASVTVLGSAKAFYLEGGRLFQLDLRRAQSRVPQPLTRQAGICHIDGVHPSNWSATDGWVAVAVPSDAAVGCHATAEASRPLLRYIRFNAAASDEAVQLPGGKRLFYPLPTLEQDGPWFFSAGTVDGYQYNADPAPLDANLVSTAGRTQPLPKLFGHPQGSSLQHPAQLQELVIQALFGSPSTAYMSLGTETYAVNGDTVTIGVGVGDPSARVVASLDPTRGQVHLRAVTPTHIIAEQQRSTSAFSPLSSLWALPRAGGTPVLLSDDADADAPASNPTTTVLGHDGTHAYFVVRRSTAFSGETTSTYRVRLADGARVALSVNAATLPVPLFERDSTLAVPPLRGLAWVDFDNPFDSTGTLKVFDALAAVTRTLGPLRDAKVSDWRWNVLGSVDGTRDFWESPLAIAASRLTQGTPTAPSRRETRFYTARPDTANSLRLVAQLP